MIRQIKNSFCLLPIALLLLPIIGCSSAPEIQSAFTSTPIAIDADLADWSGALHPLQDNSLAYGVKNDDNFLYISIATNDRMIIRKMLLAGTVVWIETPNGDKIGLRHPMRLSPEQMFERGGQPDMPGQPSDQQNRIKTFLEKQTELQALDRSGAVLETIPVPGDDPITAIIDYRNDQFVYEARLPLSNPRLRFSAAPGETVNINIITEKFEIRRPGGEGQPQGMGPRGGRDRQPGEGRQGNREDFQKMIEPLNVFFKAKLSSK